MILQTLYSLEEPVINTWINRGHNMIHRDHWSKVVNNIPVICQGNLLHENVTYWLNNKQPAIYTARGYLGNHLPRSKRFRRASVNGWANIELKKIPYSRWHILNLPRHSWKVKSIKNVLIAPSKMTSTIWTKNWNWEWSQQISDFFPGANIKIRKKLEKAGLRYKTLWSDLDWADLVVSQSSAITAEAFWYGKKVISTEPCITWAVGKPDLADWKNPVEPALRDQWHEHLAWSQFSISEWNTGDALDLIQKYFGPIDQVRHDHRYSF
jgi:hypothetical protein